MVESWWGFVVGLVGKMGGRCYERGLRVLVTPANEIFTLNPLGNIALECDKLPVSYF